MYHEPHFRRRVSAIGRTPYGAIPEVRLSELISLGRELLQGSRLLVASNRGPIQYAIGPSGALEPRRGAGGVVTALTALQRYLRLTWVASALSDGDRRVADTEEKRLTAAKDSDEGDLAARFVAVPPAVFRRYYSVFANPLLWFLQHYMWDPALHPDIDRNTHRAWDDGYVVVNEAFAQALIDEARRPDASRFIMLHDYHLYLVGGMIRKVLPDIILQHFIHIPWPDPDYWHILPAQMRRAIFAGLCSNDIVGMQTHRSVTNFLSGCQAYLPGAEIGWGTSTIFWQGRELRVRAYPISIDVQGLRETMAQDPFRRAVEKMKRRCGTYTIVRTDRLEPSKNILRGFKAFDILLRRHRNLREKVKFLAFLVPSRTSVPQYKSYLEETRRLVAEINERHGTKHWKPIEVIYEDNYVQALAGMSLADVMMVNPIIDGMNLVAKEAPIVNSRDAVMILSEGAGAFEQLQDGVLAVAPADIEGTVKALEQALAMPVEERARRAALLRAEVEHNDISMWLYQQLRDLAMLLPELSQSDLIRHTQLLTR
ncbi:MAG: trehalose-6-phosphate synthase [Chloroflexota bacterium]